ncbi:Zf-FLZ domain containing protein [Parasponia andersonii]|uniref:Zf-FLZ domain containing protein n=1 Tax=Parasponia andersonii TaxID=3476 RepID=A0A2P5CX60_PARAD|nr:Zf-FLZ domain containing protein [Parasponia andersonii]
MLRKRTRSIQKDQHQMGHQPISDSGSESFFQSDVGNDVKRNSFYSVPGLLVGLSSMGLTDCDSVRSPTSPLDFRLFSNLGNSFRSTKSTRDGQQRGWGNSNKVGLSIIESLDDDDMKFSGKVLRSSASKNILFGPKLRIKAPNGQANSNSFESPKSLPKNNPIFPHSKTKSPLQKGCSDVLFEIGDSSLKPDSLEKIRSCSLDSCRTVSNLSGLYNFNNTNSTSMNFCLESKITTRVCSPGFVGGSPKSNQLSGTKLSTIPGSIGSGNEFIEPLSPSEIELSEDYTCVISHGPNPKTTHIYGDCILEAHSGDLSNSGKREDKKDIALPEPIENSEVPVSYPSDHFLSFCFYCNKKLEEDKDIYIYRGEKAFCSLSCRSLEILIDEEFEKSNDKNSEHPLNSDDYDGEALYETGLIAAA